MLFIVIVQFYIFFMVYIYKMYCFHFSFAVVVICIFYCISLDITNRLLICH